MDNLDFSRSRALNNIPKRKLHEKLAEISSTDEDIKIKNVKLIAINRYAESNIPIEYWGLKMEKDFTGDQRLLTKYNEYCADLKQSYRDGVSICFAGGHGRGKQLSLDTELPTPNGFIKLMDLKEGDKLFDEQGNICNVLQLHPINLSPESYQIEFDDGTKVEACADHLWFTWDSASRKSYQRSKNPTIHPQVRNTKEILKTLISKGKRGKNHSIPCIKPVNYSEKKLLVDPYVLGCWLGDGETNSGAIECADQDILTEIQNVGYSVNLTESSQLHNSKSRRYRIGDLIDIKIKNTPHKIGLLCQQLKQINVLNNKHVPDEYLYSSYEQRLSLIQGLMDTDGCCLNTGVMEYCTVLPELAKQIQQLIHSMGIKCSLHKNESWLYDKRCKDRYRIKIITQLPIFRLKRKLKNIRLKKNQLAKTTHRYIVNIIPIDPKPMRCITVDSPNHLFLITRSFIPTHNTMAVSCILKKACGKNFSCLYTTLTDIVNTLTQASGDDKYLARRELSLIDFLVIDEFDPRFMPSENAADLYARSLEGIFRARSQNKLPTLMCTNSPNVVKSFHGALQESIDSLMKGYLTVFPVFGDDFRKKGL
jgi:hypothetical protein